MHTNTKAYKITFLLSLFFCFIIGNKTASAQIYQHNFNSGPYSHPYTVAPAVLSTGLSGSSWTNSAGSWSDAGGSTGQALSFLNNGTITLTFTVNPNNQAAISSYSFWARRSNTGANAYSLKINGTTVGTGTIPSGGGSVIGPVNVSTPVAGLTGTVAVEIVLSGSTNAQGTFRLDDFTLNGAVTPTCIGAVITSFTPLSAPANTVINLNGTGFTNTTAVAFNNIPATAFTVLSDTQLQATVPSGAVTGNITVTAANCPTQTALPFTVLASNCSGGGTEIFISEVYDQRQGNGGMIELYNPTAGTIDLSNYIIQRYGDIGDPTPTTGYILPLSGDIGAGQTFLIAGTTPNQTYCATPIASIGFPAGFNGNDRLELLKNNVLIDRVDVPFTGPGYTLIRNENAVAPLPVYNINDWDNTQHGTAYLPEYCSDLGEHYPQPSVVVPTLTQPASQIICENGQAAFTVTLSNPAGFTYQWKVLNNAGIWVNVVNGANYSGATTNTLTVNQVPVSFNGNQYYCEISSLLCTLVSNAAQLTVIPTPSEPGVQVEPITCTNPTATLTVTPPTTDPGYSYSINNGATYQSSNVFENLGQGTYQVVYKLNNGCPSLAAQVIIDPAPAPLPAVTATPQNPDCTNPVSGLTITQPTGTGFIYRVTLNGTTTTITQTNNPVFTGLQPGLYSIEVENTDGCTATGSVTIAPAPAPLPAVIATPQNPDCTNPIGGLTITQPTGTGFIYTITLNGTNTTITQTNNPVFTGLQPGLYSIEVENTDGCTATGSVTINPAPAPLPVVTATPQNPDCTNPIGGLTITQPTGTGFIYTITLNGTNTTITQTNNPVFTGLQPGLYTIEVENTDGCTATGSVTIDAAPALLPAVTATPQNPDCTNPISGLTITQPTGTGFIYTITLNGTNTTITQTNNPVFTGLQPGLYSIEVENTDGCTATGSVTINPAPAPLPAVTATPQNPDCTNPVSGLTITQPTGTGFIYTITLNGTNTTITQTNNPVFTGLQPGLYSIEAENTDGCTATGSVTIDAAPAPLPAVTATPQNPDCTSTVSGLTITQPTGTGFIYTITLNGTNTTITQTNNPVFTGLQPGLYTIEVENTDGCTATGSVTINPAPAPLPAVTATPQNPDCTSPVSGLTITQPTGTGFIYTITLNGTNTTITQTNNPVFTGLQPGTYSIEVENTDGCTATGSVTINPAPAPLPVVTATPQNPTCTNPVSGLTITQPTGTGFIYTITLNGINTTITQTNNPVFTGLQPGLYNIEVENTDGCTATGSVTIAPAPNTATQPDNITGESQVCTGSQIQLFNTVTGGTWTSSNNAIATVNSNGTVTGNMAGQVIITYTGGLCTTPVTKTITVNALPKPALKNTFVCIDPATNRVSNQAYLSSNLSPGSYTFTWTRNGTQLPFATSAINVSETGTYTVTATNIATGCSATSTAVVGTSSIAIASATVGTDFSRRQTIGVTVTGGTGEYEFSLDNENFQTENTFTNIIEGEYTVYVKDRNGCGTAELNVYALNYPRFFSPNQDGKRDSWNISGLRNQPDARIYIFDRYGKVITTLRPGYAGWDGTYNGERLPATDYWFMLNYRSSDGTEREFKAHFSLLR